MSNSMNPRGRAGRSPFDSIRHTDIDPEAGEFEYWRARELMGLLGYERWDTFSDAIERAKAGCQLTTGDAAQHFKGCWIQAPRGNRGGLQAVEDVHLTRLGCYLVAMASDTRKPPVARALQYFAVQTRRAELLLPPPSAAAPPSADGYAWVKRFRLTAGPHVRELHRLHPGCFSVVSAITTEMMVIEDVIIQHQMTTRSFDRPDISIGLTWGNYRRGQGLPEATRQVGLFLPDQDLTVPVLVYDGCEWSAFSRWFRDVYLTVKLYPYLDRKPELKEYQSVVRGSAADNACRELTGNGTKLPPMLRKLLDAAGGFITASQLPPGPSRPRVGG